MEPNGQALLALLVARVRRQDPFVPSATALLADGVELVPVVDHSTNYTRAGCGSRTRLLRFTKTVLSHESEAGITSVGGIEPAVSRMRAGVPGPLADTDNGDRKA